MCMLNLPLLCLLRSSPLVAPKRTTVFYVFAFPCLLRRPTFRTPTRWVGLSGEDFDFFAHFTSPSSFPPLIKMAAPCCRSEHSWRDFVVCHAAPLPADFTAPRSVPEPIVGAAGGRRGLCLRKTQDNPRRKYVRTRSQKPNLPPPGAARQLPGTTVAPRATQIATAAPRPQGGE